MSDASRSAAESILAVAYIHDALALRDGRTPAQWRALRYFNAFGEPGGTLSGFASAHAVSVSSASQTVEQLVRRGLLSRERMETDRRAISIRVTDEGRAALDDDPIHRLAQAVDDVPDTHRDALDETLRSIARTLIRRRDED